MRVTQGMMNSQLMANLNANNTRLNKYQDILATGKKLNKPSDDPVAVGYAMRYDAMLSRNDQFQRNVDDAVSHLDFMDTTLGQVNDILKRARELTVRGSDGTMSAEARAAIAGEVDQLYNQLVQTGNTQFNDRYVFNGQITDVAPYDPANAMYNETDTGTIVYMMSEGTSVPINVIGNAVFGQRVTPGNEATADNAFAILKTLRADLAANNQAGISSALSKLDVRISSVQQSWSDVGARANRVELLDNRLKDFNLNLNTLMSKTVDADIAETITEMKMAESVQRSSLSTGARIIQPTLTDFLK